MLDDSTFLYRLPIVIQSSVSSLVISSAMTKSLCFCVQPQKSGLIVKFLVILRKALKEVNFI